MKKIGQFAARVAEFMDYRWQLGYKMHHVKGDLRNLADFMDREAPEQPLTYAWIVRWREANPHRSPRCVYSLKSFVSWLSLRDPKTAVSEAWFHRDKSPRPTPYIYETGEILSLMASVEKLGNHGGKIRLHTYGALLGLLASTGLRIGEALALDDDDIDWKAGVLRVRESKGVPLRMVPLHESTTEALRRYAKLRDSDRPVSGAKAFFIGSHGRRLFYETFHPVFRTLADVAGVPFRPHPQVPRIHDLRHTFATRHLLRIRHEGGDMHCAVADLSVYLGHKRIENTYWYLTGIPELMALCGERFRTYVEARRREGRP